MSTYLAIMTTVLVATQIVRVVQNGINLHMNNKKIKAALNQVSDITEEDLKTQREAYRLIVEHFGKGGKEDV